MSLRLKSILAFFILSSLLLVSVFAPSLFTGDKFSFTDEHRAGVLAAAKFMAGNICCPENRNETFLRGETQITFNPGTSINSVAAVYGFPLSSVFYSFYSKVLEFAHNPVRIAQFNHLGDGMK